MPRFPSLLFLLIVLSAGTDLRLDGHDTFFRVASHNVDPGDPVEVTVFHGTFQESVLQIGADHPETLQLQGPLGSAPIDMEGWRQSGFGNRIWAKWQLMRGRHGWIDRRMTSSFRTTLPKDGTYVVAMALKPAGAAMTPEIFVQYLRSEGLGDEPIARQEYADSSAIITELYSKFVKIILQAGSETTPNVMKPAGLAVEFVPLVHPVNVSPGEKLPFQLLRNGEPRAHQPIKAARARPGDTSKQPPPLFLRSDESGRVDLPIDERGVWWISFVAIDPSAPGSETQYESQWATLTFEIP